MMIIGLMMLCVLVLGEKPRSDVDLHELAEAATVVGVYALDQAIEHRWELLSKLTGREPPIIKPKVAEAEALLRTTLVDASIGAAVRRWWLPVTATGIALGAWFYFRRRP
jgi:hypothetical protein